MRSVHDWLREYGTSHENRLNKTLHWICVPLIVFAVLGLLWAIPVPPALAKGGPFANWAVLAALASLGYYAWLAPRLAIGMLPLVALALLVLERLAAGPLALWRLSLAIFVVAWIGQFIGHAVEGRRPSFFKDVQFLLIGPLWLLGAAYRRLGLRY
ncbi:MAG: DUF962 domain-containing protein [Proteobacteria bacterium]|nr:DUF962 domain-containing protein [Pseudomonadota bacterium]